MINDVEEIAKKLSFNRAQKNFVFNLALIKYAKLIWGRATGKSTIIAWLWHIINMSMPRSCWNIQAATYQQALTKTLPGTIAELEKLGYVRDRDFFINKFPPNSYLRPYQCPAKAENIIFLVNHKNKCSVGFAILSQDRSNSRGPNRDGCICDESLLLDIDKFNAETKPTIRGNREYFGKNNLHGGIFHFTSMPHTESFLFEGNEYYENDGVDSLNLRSKIADYQLAFIKEKDKNQRLEIWSEILELEKNVKFYAKNKLYYSEYNAFDNIKGLGLQYIIDQLADSTELLFSIEILNKRLRKIGNSFYANFNRAHHGYKGHYDYSYIDKQNFDFDKLQSVNSLQDLDCHPKLPICVGMDFGTDINWLIAGQEIQSANQFNVLKSFIVKTPKIIDDIVKDFCDYYIHHKHKVIHLYADAEGNNRRPNVQGQTTYNEQVIQLFRDNGWSVVNMSINNKNPHHELKYLLWARCLNPANEGRTEYPTIRFNLINCKELIVSMENSPTKDNNNKIGKDKGSEKKLKTNREQATDGGDALDQIIFGKYADLMNEVLPFKALF